MTYGDQKGGYSPVAKFLHWSVAVCVLITIPVAFAMNYLASGGFADFLYNFHKSLGILILVLMIARISNRLVHGAPEPYPGLEKWERSVSSAVHGLLYVLLVAMPVVGWAANSAYGAPTPFFGLFNLPPILPKNEPLSDTLFTLHRYTGWLVATLAALHIGGGLKHFIIQHDGVLQRMLPKRLGGI
jgi:cytochrome b561